MAEQNNVTFEQALAQLEHIVTEIEQGQVSLEESIEKYAQGTQLITKCRSILDEAEKKIALLSRGEGNALNQSGELADE